MTHEEVPAPDPAATDERATLAAADSDPARSATPAARRRLGLVAFTYGYRAIAGLLVALPAAVALGGPVSGWPRGPRELFDPGGVMLVEALRLARRGVDPAGVEAAAILSLAMLVGVFPLAALLTGLGREGRLPAGFLAGRAWSHAGTLALLSVATLPAQVLAGAVVAFLGGKLIGAFELTPPAHDLASVAVGVVVLGVVCAAGVLRDVAFAAAVRGDHGFYVAAARALWVARRSGGRAFLAWALRASPGMAGLVLAAWLAPSLAGASAAAIVAGVLLHQAAIAGATFARASWLAAAMRLYDRGE